LHRCHEVFQRTQVKRSSNVAAPLLASAALTILAGCRDEQMQRCVDQHNVVVDDSFCQTQPGQQNNNYYHPPGGIYRYYYGGAGSYSPGSAATGGGFSPQTGHSYATSRGGFGSSFGGEGEGHGAGE
jgi:hypothetical protein